MAAVESPAALADETSASASGILAQELVGEGVRFLEAEEPFRLRDINLVVTTDMHSWVSGRAHEPFLNASLGHAVSLAERLKEIARSSKQDVFFFDNGDINDGTGLSATDQDHVGSFAPLVRLAPYDALNLGNHELYQLNGGGAIPGEPCAVAGLRDSGYIAHWRGRYLTSNTVWRGSGKPVGSRFTLLEGANAGTRLLVFGFLYNMKDHCDEVEVQDVEATVRSPWFLDALTKHAATSHAIVVLAHMDYRDPLIDAILVAIRGVAGKTKPVQFLAGHSHLRGSRRLDGFAAALEAGCKLDTLGLAAFDRPSGDTASLDFVLSNLDGNTARLAAAAAAAGGHGGSGASELLEPKGRAVHSAVVTARHRLRLADEIGCSDRRYHVLAPLSDPDSFAGLYAGHIMPEVLFDPAGPPSWAVMGTSALLYDIFDGPVTVDDAYTASPFGNFWLSIDGLNGSTLSALFEHLNNGRTDVDVNPRAHQGGAPSAGQLASRALGGPPPYVSTGPLEEREEYRLIFNDFDAAAVDAFLLERLGDAAAAAAPPKPAVFRRGSNTSSIVADWFRQKPCPPQAPPLAVASARSLLV